jgi:hypothetical protein
MRLRPAYWGGVQSISPLFGCIPARSLYNAGFRIGPGWELNGRPPLGIAGLNMAEGLS